MGLFEYTVTGGGFILVGAWESIVSTARNQSPSLPSSSEQPLPQSRSTVNSDNKGERLFSSAVIFISIAVLSCFSIANSVVSLSDAVNVKDNTGFVLQFGVMTIAFLFLLYSLLGFLTHVKSSFNFPLAILNLIYLFAFGEEFLLFYLQRKDPNGVENRYYDLLLVPITICLFSTVLELKNPKSYYARLGRGIGLVLQGTWILQMGFSFFSKWIAHGCALHQKSRGNYTIKCKGHPEYHRGAAIATLLFNCHLSLLVTVIIVVYSIICKKRGITREDMRYRPLGDMQQLESHAHFTLDSDDEEDGNGIKEASSVEMQKAIVPVPSSGINGYSTHA